MKSRAIDRRKRKLKKLLLGSFIVTFALIFLGGSYIWSQFGESYNPISRLNDGEKPNATGASKDVLEEPIAIMLLGIDSDETDVGRSDTIMVMVLNPKDKSITLVSLPRDTYVEIAGKKYKDKVNHSMNYGIPTVLATLENFFDIHIDHYATIDFQGFVKAIDALGGIEVNVENRMKYTDRAGGLYIDLQPGLQTLNGDQALGYARFRHDKYGDLGRIKRQQEVIKKVLDKSTEFRSAAHIFELVDIVGDHFKTDIKRTDLLRILSTYKDATGEDVVSIDVQGGSDRFGPQNLWYFLVEEQERQRLHNILSNKLSSNPTDLKESLKAENEDTTN